MFPLNAWYVACTPDEIDEKPLGRSICGERLVFYRGPDGKAAALEDWCPHRGAPLSLGRVVEGKLVCGYHGLEMGCDGKTIAMPGQRVRGFPPIRSFPVIEQHGFVWVWPGDAAQAERRAHAASALGRSPRVGLWRRAVPHQVRLPADDRQPDGPHARDLRARQQHRPERDRRGAVQDARSKATAR